MRRFSVFVFLMLSKLAPMFAQDLPNPPANLQTLPSGSYVIPMDNTYQLNSNGIFNLKTYGLIVHLLNNNVKIKWVIKSGKIKDAIDFTATVQKVKPALTGLPLSADFRGGPFVIYATDVAGVSALVDAFYTSNGLTGNDRPNIYQTTLPVTVDIHYDLTGFIPKAAILTDGGNQAIHVGYMQDAAVPAISYSTSAGTDLTAGCYTFATEPHNLKFGAVVDAAITNIKNFVLAGGNFLAQCAAVANYENNPLGRFQTTTGISITNSNIGTTGTYSNADLSYSQFVGTYDASIVGVVMNWKISGAGINNEHNHYIGAGALSTNIGASVSKVKTGIGGLVFYLGNHQFTDQDMNNANGMRMYLNAFLTPGYMVCGATLPLQFINFTAIEAGSRAQLKWSVAENDEVNFFEIEKSTDGIHFNTISKLSGKPKSGLTSYFYSDDSYSNQNVFYRVKIIKKNGNIFRSKIVLLNPSGNKEENNLTFLNNPFKSTIKYSYYAKKSGVKGLNIYNVLGKQIYTASIAMNEGSNSFEVPMEPNLSGGIYFFELQDGDKKILKKLIKQ